jgi:hypothetical protein
MIGNLASLPIKSNFLPIVDRPLFRALHSSDFANGLFTCQT